MSRHVDEEIVTRVGVLITLTEPAELRLLANPLLEHSVLENFLVSPPHTSLTSLAATYSSKLPKKLIKARILPFGRRYTTEIISDKYLSVKIS